MPDPTIRIARTLTAVEAAAWDACANPPGLPHDPFVSHAFLIALERSTSVGSRAGWSSGACAPLQDGERLVGAAPPSYVKTHSLGEYVFDQSWADAYERAGGRYYPKLQVAAPFTPVPGRRLLVAADAPDGARAALIEGLRALRSAVDASSYPRHLRGRGRHAALAEAGFSPRTGVQYHFPNPGYRDFEDFLGTLSSRKRKAIRRERREALAGGVEIDLLTGDRITQAHWDSFYAFYIDTGARKWGRPYLARAFFDDIGASMADRILLVMARRGGRHIAGAIKFSRRRRHLRPQLGGRWRAALPAFRGLLLSAIDYAIRCGYARVEAGAQGEHKLARGYRPVATRSAHDFADKGFAAAVEAYLVRERAAVAQAMREDEEALPYRRD